MKTKYNRLVNKKETKSFIENVYIKSLHNSVDASQFPTKRKMQGKKMNGAL